MSITRETIYARDCAKLMVAIDKINDIMDGVEVNEVQVCNYGECKNCPLYVLLTDYPKGMCMERVVRQAQVQMRDPSRKYVPAGKGGEE